MAEQQIELVHLTRRDTSALRSLTEQVGWNFSLAQAQMHLSAGNFVGHRDATGMLVSSAGLYVYEGGMSALGIVIVHPNFQRRGLGRSAVTNRLNYAASKELAVRLVATPVGEPLYAGLGFRTIGQLARLYRTADHTPICSDRLGMLQTSTGNIRPYQPEHFQAIVDLDEKAYGARREGIYSALLTTVDDRVVCVDDTNWVRGFGLASKSGETLRIGAIVAETEGIAKKILAHYVTSATDALTLRIDVPAQQKSFIRILSEIGFAQSHQSACMVWNLDNVPGKCGMLFSIPDPAF